MSVRISKLLIILSTLLINTIARAQEKRVFGTLTQEEQNFKSYPKDSTAHAVILYERGYHYFNIINNKIRLIKKYHGILKILDQKGFDEGTINIELYKGKNTKERIKDLKAITHNGKNKRFLSKKKVFSKDVNENWIQVSFAMGNIKKGSILEYSYTITSPYIYNFSGWDFQSHLPKLHSEFEARIPGNYTYNRFLSGKLKLTVNTATIKKGCFHVPGYPNPADCEVLKYVMKDIPVFHKDENYMLAASNYISRLTFEMSVLHNLNGSKKRFTKSWKDVDKEFSRDKDIGRQLSKKGYFYKKLTEDFTLTGTTLQKAQKIYTQLRDRISWNGKYGIYKNIRVKEAYEERTGNIGEINIALTNLLNAAEIPSKIVLVSTRNNGLPKKKHPVITDFNYIIVKTTIEGEEYLLDATDDYIPFGMLPFRALNYYGRVMDFKNESSWLDIKAFNDNKKSITSMVEIDLENKLIKGKIRFAYSGYNAIEKKRKIGNEDWETYLTSLEKSLGQNFAINNHKLVKYKEDKKLFSESFSFENDGLEIADNIYINPFLVKFFTTNPFKRETRNFPIDFGYKRSYKYQINIKIPEGYELEKLPENENVAMPENLGHFNSSYLQNRNLVSINFSLNLNSSYYGPSTYPYLKELFKNFVDKQNNTLLVLRKK
ncbi:MAG: DUF3858 domain-containing protein [Cellulophaga sp.]